MFQMADDPLQRILHVQEPLAHRLELGALADQVLRNKFRLVHHGMILPFGVCRVQIGQMVGNLHMDIVSHSTCLAFGLGFGFGHWVSMDSRMAGHDTTIGDGIHGDWQLTFLVKHNHELYIFEEPLMIWDRRLGIPGHHELNPFLVCPCLVVLLALVLLAELYGQVLQALDRLIAHVGDHWLGCLLKVLQSGGQ